MMAVVVIMVMAMIVIVIVVMVVVMIVVMIVIVIVIVMMVMAVSVRQCLFFSRSLRTKTLNSDLAGRFTATLAHNGLPVLRWIIV